MDKSIRNLLQINSKFIMGNNANNIYDRDKNRFVQVPQRPEPQEPNHTAAMGRHMGNIRTASATQCGQRMEADAAAPIRGKD